MSGISYQQRDAIFQQMLIQNINTFKNGPTDKPIIVIFEGTKPGCKSTYNYADQQTVENTIITSVGTTYMSLQVILPQVHQQMEPQQSHTQKLIHMFNDKWQNKTNTELVFLGVFPAGLDENPMFPDFMREMLGGCFEISTYKISIN